jgi:hypothetical protein
MFEIHRGLKMTQIEMKRDPYLFTIAGILCLFNIPIILLLTLNNYSIWHILGLIVISVATQFCLAGYISNLFYFHHKSIVENMVKLEPSPFIKRIKITSIIMFLGFYCVFLYLLTQKGTDIKNILPILNMMNIMYLPYLVTQGNLRSCYIGDKSFIYGPIQVKVDDIERYEIKTLKKYKGQKTDKIQLKIFPKTGKEIVVFSSPFSYKLIEELDKVFEKRYIDEKMREYDLL